MRWLWFWLLLLSSNAFAAELTGNFEQEISFGGLFAGSGAVILSASSDTPIFTGSVTPDNGTITHRAIVRINGDPGDIIFLTLPGSISLGDATATDFTVSENPITLNAQGTGTVFIGATLTNLNRASSATVNVTFALEANRLE